MQRRFSVWTILADLKLGEIKLFGVQRRKSENIKSYAGILANS